MSRISNVLHRTVSQHENIFSGPLRGRGCPIASSYGSATDRMHAVQKCGLLLEMCSVVCVSVCLSVGHETTASSAKTVEPPPDAVSVEVSGGIKKACARWGGPDPAGEWAILGVVIPPPHWNALDCVSSERRGSTGLRTCLQGTARHGESEASEWTRPPRGWQVRGRCGLSSKFFDRCGVISAQHITLFRLLFPAFTTGVWAPSPKKEVGDAWNKT